MSKFSTLLSQTTIERQVEDLYNEQFKKFFKDIVITNPSNCDAFFSFELERKKNKSFSVLIEYKYFEDFQKPVARAKALSQILFYLKKFENTGRTLPAILIVADKNQCFIHHLNDLMDYLEFDGVNWDIAPSAAASNAELVLALSEDASLNPFVFEVNEDFDFKDVYDKIISIATETKFKIKLTEHNVERIFKYFNQNLGLQPLQANDAVSLFFGVMTGNENVYLHPTKNNVIVSYDKQIRIDSNKLKMFTQHFNTECSPKEKARLAAISDRLIEDTNRRRKGEFYTPTVFVDYSQQMISDQLGEDWREKYVVWDPAWGTGNLTRDYYFKELYASTLEQAELDIGSKHNPEATKFKFDFLNDPLENLPTGLLEAFKQDKPILFYLNPPYKTVSYTNGGTDGKAKTSKVNAMMKADNIGSCSQEVYAQFLYRLLKIKEQFNLTNCIIALFCKPLFMTSFSFEKFRNIFLKNFKFEEGIIFNSSHFSNTASSWGITFNIWSSGQTEDIYNFKHTIIGLDDTEEIFKKGTKVLYNLDDSHAYLMKKCIKKQKREDEWPNLKYPKKFEFVNTNVKKVKESIGTLYFGTHSFGASTTCYYHGHDYCITPDNISDAAVLFAVINNRDINWIDDTDNAIMPDKEQEKYSEFANNALIWMIFNSYDFSLRNVSYHGKSWSVPNNFFWLSKSEIEDIADYSNLDDVYADAHTASDRFIYKKLQDLKLSEEAQIVLDKASELLKKSFKYRKLFNSEHPEVQVMNWDAGWYQIKQILKEFMPNELKEFNSLFKKLAEKMRPMVYELGFLKKQENSKK